MARSGDRLTDRRCRLTIATPVSTPNDFKDVTTQVTEIDGGITNDRNKLGLRLKFKITKTLKKEPNTSEIIVTNLNQNSRASLQVKGVRCLLEAGYKDTGVSKIFSGDVRTVDHIRNVADWDTTMKLGDGERAWVYARVYESFSPGVRIADVIKTAAKGMGIDMGNVNAAVAGISAVFSQGFVIAGSASAAMTQLIETIGYTWSVQDNQIQILKPDQVLDLPVPEISQSSGLIGSPEMGTPTKKGKPALVKFKSLLIPMKPGSKVKLISDRYNGYVRVEACTFSGDTGGGEWYTEISGSVLK